MVKEVIIEEESKNNKCFPVPQYQANEAAEEIIDLVLELIFNSELPVQKGDSTEAIDASHDDVRLKPGFVMPVKVKKPKAVKKKVLVDTFYDYLAYPGERVLIPDVADETWHQMKS